MYTPMSERVVGYRHSGRRSPLILRVESAWDTSGGGSLRIEEYENHAPRVECDGDQTALRAVFSHVRESVRRYLRPEYFLCQIGYERDYPGLFELDLRRPNYRILLGEGHIGNYRTLIIGNQDSRIIQRDLMQTAKRLEDLFKIFYGIEE